MSVLSKFYDYQLDAFAKIQASDKGQVLMPTGTGKTFVQAGVIAHDIQSNDGFRLYVVNAPRIMLSFQLMREVQGFLLSNDLEAKYLAVHSGRVEDDAEISRLEYLKGVEHFPIDSTTSSDGIKNAIKAAKKDKAPLVIFATYHSMARIGRTKIDILLNDECHFLTEARFNDDFRKLKAERTYFFTATARVADTDEPVYKGTFMNNLEFYGDVLYKMTPYEAIQEGKMVRPRMHFITDSASRILLEEQVDEGIDTLVALAFQEHTKTLVGRDAAKLLVAAGGTKDISAILNGTEVNGLSANVYVVSSAKEIGARINGERVTRHAFLKRLKADGANSDVPMVIVHYDILSEGIDVPGITGVLFLRAMEQSKFMQTFGRAARLDLDDRRMFASDPRAYGPSDLDKMDKPYAFVIIPSLTTQDENSLSQIRTFVYNLRDYGFNLSESVIVTDLGHGQEPYTGEDAVPALLKTAPKLGDGIRDIATELECERIANLDDAQFLIEFAETI